MATPPKELIEASLAEIAETLSCAECPSPSSHTTVVVSGAADEPLAASLARYAVACIAGWVERDATIGDRLGVKGIEKRPEVLLLVNRIVVPPDGLSAPEMDNWTATWRNAWLAEILTHALFLIHRTKSDDFLPGSIVGLMRPHPAPKRQGLDVVGIYDDNDVAVIAIGETKATRDNPGGQLTTACGIFKGVDGGLYGGDLRDAIDILGDVLPEPLKSQVSNSLWEESRCYLPAIIHGGVFNPTDERPRLNDLSPVAARKRVLVWSLEDFSRFFDQVASLMPASVDALVI